MKKFLPAIAIVLAIGAQQGAVQAQNNDVHAASAMENGNGAAAATTTPKTEQAATAHTEGSEKTDDPQKPAASPSTSPSTNEASAVTLAPSAPGANGSTSATDAPTKSLVTVPNAPPATNSPAAQNPASAGAAAAPLALTNIYRIGVGDVLDIRLLNASTSESTLFTVMDGGLLEYPLAGDPLQVAGMTTEEISAKITSKVKIYDKPQVVVSVREYASHNVIVTGMVHDPGTKALRREAVPLFVLLAEAQPRAEAAQATIRRAGNPGITVDLNDSTATASLVYPGDVITLAAAPPKPPQFYFIGGQINSPGQKNFHAGLTLTQAILASGGRSRFAGSRIKVSRQGADGRLVTTEYNLKQIEHGKVPDPLIQAGDRVELTRGGW